MNRNIQFLLLAAFGFAAVHCTFPEWDYMDLIHPADLSRKFQPGFVISQNPEDVPVGCGSTLPRARVGDYMYQHYIGRLDDGTIFDQRFVKFTILPL